MIRKLKYTKVVLIYSQDEESRMVAARFQMLTDDSEIQVSVFSQSQLEIVGSNFFGPGPTKVKIFGPGPGPGPGWIRVRTYPTDSSLTDVEIILNRLNEWKNMLQMQILHH